MSPQCSASVDPVSSFHTNLSTLFNSKHADLELSSLKHLLTVIEFRKECVKLLNKQSVFKISRAGKEEAELCGQYLESYEIYKSQKQHVICLTS